MRRRPTSPRPVEACRLEEMKTRTGHQYPSDKEYSEYIFIEREREKSYS